MSLRGINNDFELSRLFVNQEGYQALVKQLNDLNVKSIISQFSGGGDSGQIDAIVFYDIDIDTFQGTWAERQTHTLPLHDTLVASKEVLRPREWESKGERTITLRQLIDELTGNALDISGLDWYNNDGGQGEMTFKVLPDELAIELEVGINYMETEDYGFRFQNFSGAGEEE